MNKKGVTWGYIVAAIIAIIVLITLIWMFRASLSESIKSWFTIIDSVGGGGEEIGKDIAELT